MKKFLLIVAIAALAVLADSQLASAGRRGGGRGGRGGCGGSGGCGGYVSCGYGGGCGSGHGGCGSGGGYVMGGCSSCGGGYGGGYVMGGCSTCGVSGGYVGGSVGGCATCGISGGGGGTCAGGVCTLGGGTAVAQANVNAATLVVTLPEDAQLTIGDEETTSTSAQRVFLSPTLEAGKQYEYTLKAKVLRDGKIQTATRKVTVRPGEVSTVELKLPAASVAAQ